MVVNNMGEFLQRFIYHRKAMANSSVSLVGATPYELFFTVPWVNRQLARPAQISLSGLKKGCWCEIWQIVKLGGHLDALRRSQLLKTAPAMGTWAKARQKRSSVSTCLVFSAQKPLYIFAGAF
jgi:hypothetical protein